MVTNIISKIKELEARLQKIELGGFFTKVTVPNTGSFILPKYASDPAGADSTQGQLYYNTATNKVKAYTGSAWVDLH